MTQTATAATADDIALQYEARLLGSLLINADQFEDVSDIVGFDDFLGSTHQVIFQTIQSLREAKEPVHPLAVSETIARSSLMLGSTAAIGLPFLQGLANDAAPAGARADARKVRERAALRRVAQACEDGLEQARNATASPEAIMAEIAEQVENTNKAIETRGAYVENFVPYARAMDAYFTKLATLAENPEDNDGITLGIEDVDDYLQFLGPGYHILAARPGCGKTALSLAITTGARESTEKHGAAPVSTLFFSADMPIDKLMMRMVAQKSGVPIGKLRRGVLEDYDWSNVTRAATDMQPLIDNLWIDPTRSLTTTEFESRVRRFMKEKKSRNGLIIIDYLQKMSVPPGVRLGDMKPLDYISQRIMDVQREYGLTILALAQLNRKMEERANKRPVMSDLKGSGNLEQDADSIFFLYRDPARNDNVEFIVAKNREGEPNVTIDLGFAGDKQQFYKVDQLTDEERTAPAHDHSSRDREPRRARGRF